MKVTFTAADPRQKARPLLDEILGRGVDQIAIACAFLTDGGVAVLERHAPRLNRPDSFVVVAWEPPTSLDAVARLQTLCPGHVYLHLGSETPVEKHVGRGLMHSKVFLARSGRQCWLWTGSHNLTASAAQGVNCEAAVVLEGDIGEQPFEDALAHLHRCRQEALLFDPIEPPPQAPAQATLVVHAECDRDVMPCPWFVHLRLATTAHDVLMRPPAGVWLYLYPPGVLHPGAQRPSARAAYSGALTAVNFTEFHPSRGIAADWQKADYVVEEDRGLFRLTDPKPHNNTPTQGIFRIDRVEDPSAVWLRESPMPRLEPVVGEVWISDVDPDSREFFTRESLQGERIVHRQYRALKAAFHLSRNEIGSIASDDLVSRLRMPRDVRMEIDERAATRRRSPLIYRAKFRV